MLLAASAAPAARNDDALVGLREVVHQLAGLVVVDDGAHRNLQHDALALAAGPVGAFAVTAALRLVLGIEAEVDQRVVALAGFHDDIAAASAVAAATDRRAEQTSPAGRPCSRCRRRRP